MKPELSDFLPYLLNQSAELVSREFQPNYKDGYGMLRTEWRVLFHLGQHGNMTARQICDQAVLHKTKVSRAVTALEQKRYLSRRRVESDRRSELLTLTKSGEAVFEDLSQKADAYDRGVESILGKDKLAQLKAVLVKLISQQSG